MGTDEPACEPDLSRMPERLGARDVPWTGSHAAGSDRGELYLAGRDDDDVRVVRVDETGAELWSATWGNVLGWEDYPNGLLPIDEGVLVTGVSGVYPSQEYPWTGTSFVRAYSKGGVVLWTWEDSRASFMDAFGRNDGPLVALGADSVVVAAPVMGTGNTRVGLRLVALSREDGVERARVEYDAPSAEPHAAWLDDSGTAWVAATTADGSLMLRWDGSSPPSVEASSDEQLFRHAHFYPDGELLVLASEWAAGGDWLRLARYSRSLELEADELVWVEGFGDVDLFDAALSFGCDGVTWIAFRRSDAAPVVAVDAALNELWETPGLGAVAVSNEHVVFAGYDAEREATAIWQMEWGE